MKNFGLVAGERSTSPWYKIGPGKNASTVPDVVISSSIGPSTTIRTASWAGVSAIIALSVTSRILPVGSVPLKQIYFFSHTCCALPVDGDIDAVLEVLEVVALKWLYY